jgi:hypothetical protein
MIDQLVSTNDPRLTAFVEKDNNGSYTGILNGLTDTDYANNQTGAKSNIGPALSSLNSRLYIIAAAESWFLRAEAALVYDNDPAKAATHFKMGIETSLKQWGADTSAISTFTTVQVAAFNATSIAGKEEMIGVQLWVALTPNFFESWSHVRRTGYPKEASKTRSSDLSLGVTNGVLPTRFLYPLFEFSTNGTNVAAAVANQGPNKINTPLWWDKN